MCRVWVHACVLCWKRGAYRRLQIPAARCSEEYLPCLGERLGTRRYIDRYAEPFLNGVAELHHLSGACHLEPRPGKGG